MSIYDIPNIKNIYDFIKSRSLREQDPGSPEYIRKMASVPASIFARRESQHYKPTDQALDALKREINALDKSGCVEDAASLHKRRAHESDEQYIERVDTYLELMWLVGKRW